MAKQGEVFGGYSGCKKSDIVTQEGEPPLALLQGLGRDSLSPWQTTTGYLRTLRSWRAAGKRVARGQDAAEGAGDGSPRAAPGEVVM